MAAMGSRSLLVLLAVLAVGCGGAAAEVRLDPGGSGVRTGTGDPQGMVELGPIEVEHGHGCGGYGRAGTYDSAYSMLRNEAARRGATYVKIVQVIEPHSEHGCFDQRFIIRGIAYAPARVDATAGASVPVTPSAPGCNPPCSPGYDCQNGQCAALCNPPCSPGYVCAQDRTCQPSTTPPEYEYAPPAAPPPAGQ